jgi:hypothetical protein
MNVHAVRLGKPVNKKASASMLKLCPLHDNVTSGSFTGNATEEKRATVTWAHAVLATALACGLQHSREGVQVP